MHMRRHNYFQATATPLVSASRMPQEKIAKVAGVYTVEDAMKHIGVGPFQIILTILAGLISLSDAMEVIILAILTPILACEWSLASWQQALMSSIVFFGYLFGAVVLGTVSDLFGRKTSILLIACIVIVFGILSAASPSYIWFLVLRFIVGFGVGGSTLGITYYMEFMSPKFRGIASSVITLFWAIGSISSASLALAIIPNLPSPLNWRLYIAVCPLPMVIAFILGIFMPESARYYVSKGKLDKGEAVIRHIAWCNRKSPPLGRLVCQEEKDCLIAKHGTSDHESIREETPTEMDEINEGNNEDEPFLSSESSSPSPPPLSPINNTSLQSNVCSFMENLKDSIYKLCRDLTRTLFLDKGWMTTLPLSVIWCGTGFVYYGLVLVTPLLLHEDYSLICKRVNATLGSNDTECVSPNSRDFIDIIWTSSAELPGLLLTLVIIDLLGRKISMIGQFVGAGIFIGLLLVCLQRLFVGVFLFTARGLVFGAFQVVYVYTPEVYPTKWRSSTMGTISSFGRVGAIITPFVAQLVNEDKAVVTISVYASTCIVLSLLCILLPIETKGRSLKDIKK